jgi:hypothetical protein
MKLEIEAEADHPYQLDQRKLDKDALNKWLKKKMYKRK